MLPSVVRNFDNATGPTSTTPLLHQLSSSSISNRKWRCVQPRHPERPTGVEGSVSSLSSTLPALSPSNRKCRCVQHRHPERPTGVEGSASSLSSTPPTLSPSNPNRKSGIKNPNNCRVFNHFHFSNRKYLAIFHHE